MERDVSVPLFFMLDIIPIPALSDNYIWLIRHQQQAIIVDPSEAEPVLAYLAKHRLDLTAIWLTHHHQDHTGGMAELLRHYPNLVVYGSAEVKQWTTHLVQGEDRFSVWDFEVSVIESAGHTEQHISYLLDQRWLFCGDSLFSAGCGRVFTGDYQAQFEGLQRFNQLADEVQIFPAHEYTLSNLKFAETVLPASEVLRHHRQWAEAQRQHQRPTLPSSLGLERQINPFLRAESLAEFVRLRQAKDQF